ncbi:translation initiation factor IF-2 [archaeon]|nr:translation initiation factor IF-2 [archaeon]|tara:strand:- start:5112 stop:6842 length:1731 start_codon:yes stop_codon:yes gene_type:complete
MIRQPIVTLVGHVDHGKSSVLDFIRQSSIIDTEAGGITQCISSTAVPLKRIKSITKDLLKQIKQKIKIPGFLFIDTPGHASFTGMRKRGGNLADLAILVIDINEGIMPQTKEAIEILKQYKTPFIIALNKIDLIPGWKKQDDFLLKNIQSQPEEIQKELDTKLYEIVGKLHELGFGSERFDRIKDYKKQIALIPISAKTNEGLPELLVTLMGLSEKFLKKELEIKSKEAKGVILEVKEEKGIGKTLDVILYDGSLKEKDIVIIGDINEPIETKIKVLLEPENLTDMRLCKFQKVKQVHASIGVKISAPNIDKVIAGMPIQSCKQKDIEKTKKEIQKEVSEVIIETDKKGIVIKADTLGSLEALTKLLKEKDFKIKRASVGNINKTDIADAGTEKNPLNRIILGFNIKKPESKIKIITSDIIYKIIEDFEKWQETKKQEIEKQRIKSLTLPCKIKILPGFIFRQSNPAVVGAEVLNGTLKKDIELMNDQGKIIATVKTIQLDGKDIDKAEKGKEVAVAFPGVTVGRQINTEDILYANIPEDDYLQFKKYKKFLNGDEIEILKEIAEIKRKGKKTWGI